MGGVCEKASFGELDLRIFRNLPHASSKGVNGYGPDADNCKLSSICRTNTPLYLIFPLSNLSKACLRPLAIMGNSSIHGIIRYRAANGSIFM